jgi:hypothetical protein
MTAHARRYNKLHATCFVLLATMIASSPSAFAAGVVSSFRSKGAFASLDVQHDDCTWLNVSVSRGGPVAAPETYLSYSVYNTCTGESSWGYGRISNRAFTVSGKRSKLDTDPTTNPDMVTSGQAGRIALTWTADQNVRWSWDGRSESITPTQRIRSRGSYESSAASVVGNLLSFPVRTQSAGQVGKNRDMYTEVVR